MNNLNKIGTALPMTLLGPIPVYTVIYWWFIPDTMRMDVPLAHVPLLVKIISTIIAIPLAIYSHSSSEWLGSALPVEWTSKIYQFSYYAHRLLNVVSAVLMISLFSPIIGMPPPSKMWVIKRS